MARPQKILTTLPPPSEAPPPYPDTQEMVAEILELTRVMAPNIQDIWGEAKTTRTIREMADAWRKEIVRQSSLGSGFRIVSGTVPSDFSDVLESGIGGFAYTPAAQGPEAPPAETPTEPSKPAVPLRRPRGPDKK